MVSSPTFRVLCCELVEDYYGDFYRTIFECLASVGRLNANQVAQKCHLPLRQARAGLAGLIQNRLVDSYTAPDTATVYSANLTNAYNVIRAGTLVEAAQQAHGDVAAAVMAMVCDLGFATMDELRDRLLCDANLVDFPAGDINQTTELLLDEHYLTHLRKSHLSDRHDVYRAIELKMLTPGALAKITGVKAKAEHEAAVESEYYRIVNPRQAEQGFTNSDYATGSQKELGAPNALNGHSGRQAELVQPNFHKLVELSKVACARDRAKKTHGEKAATIVACAIHQIADPDPWSREQPDLRRIDMLRLQHDARSKLRHQKASAMNGHGQTNGVNGHDDEEDDLHIGDVEKELLLLREGAFDFLENYGSRSDWQIDKTRLDAWTRKEETLRVMESRLDPPAPRILRILIDKGKMEEKTLQEVGLLSAKELRQCLSSMKQMGYLDLQEVPRNPQRMPNQTLFLWSHEAQRVANLVTESVYHSMVRLIQLLKLERQHLSSTLTKVERDDVRGKEEERLPAAEYIAFTRFRRFESWVCGEIHRLDTTVAILKDTST